MRTHDFLEMPAAPLPQSTPADTGFVAALALAELLKDIRYELLKNHPDVLCETVVQGGTNVLSDQIPHLVKFEIGGKPVTVYKVLLWNQTGKKLRASVTGLSNSDDGFSILAEPIQLVVPISELSIALDEAATIGINRPTSASTDGAAFIYGFTIPNYEQDTRN